MPTGNVISEQCYRRVQQIVARIGCSIQEAVYWFNVTSKDDVSSLTALANGIYIYEVRIKGVDPVSTSKLSTQNKYHLEDRLWIKPPHYICASEFQEGQVTEVISPQSVFVNRVPRNIKDLLMKWIVMWHGIYHIAGPANGAGRWDNTTIPATKHTPEIATVTMPVLWSRINRRCDECLTKQSKSRKHWLPWAYLPFNGLLWKREIRLSSSHLFSNSKASWFLRSG